MLKWHQLVGGEGSILKLRQHLQQEVAVFQEKVFFSSEHEVEMLRSLWEVFQYHSIIYSYGTTHCIWWNMLTIEMQTCVNPVNTEKVQ